MYSGTTLNNKSGAIIGTHQKVDRVAHKNLELYAEGIPDFPNITDILHFEGNNGPDGVKRKSPSKDEPWHFYDPFDEDDTELLIIIQKHYTELVKQLKKGSPERAAFDAAWLAHAVVDGLTPAHHFPYEEKMIEIRGGERIDDRDIKDKIIVPGPTVKEKVRRNWAVYGIKGVLSMHGFFEFGVAALLAPIKMRTARLTDTDVEKLIAVGHVEIFKRAAREIALLDMYDRFHDRGWTIKLSRDVRNHLGPIMVRTVALVWYSAMRDAGLLRGKK